MNSVFASQFSSNAAIKSGILDSKTPPKSPQYLGGTELQYIPRVMCHIQLDESTDQGPLSVKVFHEFLSHYECVL